MIRRNAILAALNIAANVNYAKYNFYSLKFHANKGNLDKMLMYISKLDLWGPRVRFGGQLCAKFYSD